MSEGSLFVHGWFGVRGASSGEKGGELVTTVTTSILNDVLADDMASSKDPPTTTASTRCGDGEREVNRGGGRRGRGRQGG